MRSALEEEEEEVEEEEEEEFFNHYKNVMRGEWSPQPRITFKHSIFNSNKQYI